MTTAVDLELHEELPCKGADGRHAILASGGAITLAGLRARGIATMTGNGTETIGNGAYR